MYKSATWGIPYVVLVLLLPYGGAAARDWSTAPESGTFQAQLEVNSTGGSGCLDKSGDVFLGSMSFPGLSGSTWYLRELETGPGAAFDSLYTLTVTGGKGTTSPSGSFKWIGDGIGGSWSESGTFTSSVTEISTHAFVMQLVVKYGSCTETLNIPLVRIGVNQ